MRDYDYEELKRILVPGKSFRFFYNAGNPSNSLAHIRAIVDDEWIVWRKWAKSKRRWIYLVDHIHLFWLHRQDRMVEEESEEHLGT